MKVRTPCWRARADAAGRRRGPTRTISESRWSEHRGAENTTSPDAPQRSSPARSPRAGSRRRREPPNAVLASRGALRAVRDVSSGDVPAGARARRSPDEPRGSPPTPYQRKQTPLCVWRVVEARPRVEEWGAAFFSTGLGFASTSRFGLTENGLRAHRRESRPNGKSKGRFDRVGIFVYYPSSPITKRARRLAISSPRSQNFPSQRGYRPRRRKTLASVSASNRTARSPPRTARCRPSCHRRHPGKSRRRHVRRPPPPCPSSSPHPPRA